MEEKIILVNKEGWKEYNEDFVEINAYQGGICYDCDQFIVGKEYKIYFISRYGKVFEVDFRSGSAPRELPS